MPAKTSFPFGVSLIFLSTKYDEMLQRDLVTAGVETVEIAAALVATTEQRSTVKRLLETRRVRASSIHSLFGSNCDYSSLNPETWQTAVSSGIQAVETAAELNIPIVVAHASAEPIPPEERSRRLDRAVEGLKRVGEQAQATGRRIAIEYLPRTCLGNSLPELTGLLDRLGGDPFGVCLDVNHLMDRSAELPQIVRSLGKRTIATHLSDYDGVDEKHWLPGQGVLDWSALVRALREIEYPGPFTYECNANGNTPAEKLAVLRENFQWLSSLV